MTPKSNCKPYRETDMDGQQYDKGNYHQCVRDSSCRDFSTIAC